MSEIPEDIMAAARAALDPWTIDNGTTRAFEACAEDVARAILAERERCAKIAESCCWDFPEDRREAVQIETCDVIARAIRTPSTGEEQ